MPTHFNVRVYGLLLRGGQVLVNDEIIRGRAVRKFPGGGLELGEGTREGLRREFREELGLNIRVGAHFYTTDYFVQSAWDDSQVLSVYYLVEAVEAGFVLTNLFPDAETSTWVALAQIRAEDFTLPIDRTVARMLRDAYGPDRQ